MIGAGGMGEVYRARDERLQRDVALKVLPSGTLADEASRRRFRKEALALSRLNDPNIATIHDFDTHAGMDYLVMEYVAGEPLGEKLRAGPLPENEVARLGVELAKGLAAAHGQGVIHRDLKPGNLRLTRDGRLKILDFGLARLGRRPSDGALAESKTETAFEGIVGTLPYMAPEQVRREGADTRTDLYASGAVLYEMATGQRPFADLHDDSLADAILTQAPAPPTELNRKLSPALERIILKALDKSRERRYQSATDLAIDLERLSAPTPAAASRPRRSTVRRSRRALLGAAGAICLVTVAVLLSPRLRERVLGRTSLDPARPSLAVLYFRNLGPTGDDEHFAAGVTEEVITSLSQIRGLRVASRSSVDRYRGLEVDPRRVGRDLNVGYVLEGSIQRSGEDLRVTAQLINSKDGFHVWADRYEGKMAGIFAVQDTIASRIASVLRATIAPEERAKISRRWTANAQAYACYLTGREIYFDVARPRHDTGASTWFERAIALDPDYAPALAGLADVLVAAWGSGRRPRGAVARAFALAEKAKGIDPLLATAWRAEGRAHMVMKGDLRKARQALERSVAVNPGVAESHWQLGILYALLGRRDQALAMVRRAVQIDPDWPNAYLDGVNLYRDYGLYDEAEKFVDGGLARLPNQPLLQAQRATILVARRRYPEAIAILRPALAAMPDLWRARFILADCLHQLHRDTEADSVLRTAIARWPDTPSVLNLAATYQLARGRWESAEALVVKAIQIDPDYYYARRSLGECYLKAGREKEAERVYLELAKRWPEEAEARVDVARFYWNLKRYREAEAWAKGAIRLNPEWEAARGQLGWDLFAQGDYEQAAQAFRKAIQLRPDSYWNYHGLARTLQAAGRIHESLKPARSSVELKPDYLDGLMTLGRAYDLAGERHRAAEAYERVLAIDSTRTGALNNLANIYTKEERFQRALTLYRRAAQLDTVGTIYWANIANLSLIHLRDLRGAREAAATCLRRGRGTQAEASALQMLGVVEEMQGHRDVAQSHYRKGLVVIGEVLRRNPNDRAAVATAGYLCARVGEVAKARRHAEWLARTQKEVPGSLYGAASIMAVAGEEERAMEYLNSAVAAGFDDRGLMSRDPDLDRIRKRPEFKGLLAAVQ